MTAPTDRFHWVVARLGGRITGQNRAIAHCPAGSGHKDGRDRSPSLSIGVGRDGRVLLNCFSGCRLAVVLKHADLRPRDLFPNTPPSSPAEQVRQRREMLEQQERQRAAVLSERERADRYRELATMSDAIAARLARTSDASTDGEMLTRLYHDSLSRLRATEAEFDAIEAARYHERLQRSAEKYPWFRVYWRTEIERERRADDEPREGVAA